jgi:PPIC-type PPIASE domain
VVTVPKLARISIAYSAAFLVAIGLSGCGAASGEVVARVGTVVITKGVFDHWRQIVASMSPTRRFAATGQTLARALIDGGSAKQRTLAFLIFSARTIGEAADDDIEATDAEVKSALARYRYERVYGTGTALSRDAALQVVLSDKAETRSDRSWIVKVSLLATKVAQRQLREAEGKVTRAQLARYYARRKKHFVTPERRTVAVIETVRRAKIEQAKREIESGQSLLRVVKRRNDEPAVGGLKRDLSRRSLRHGYERDFFDAEPGVLVGPLKAEIYFLFEVIAVIPARQQTLREVQAGIRRRLIAGPDRQILTNSLREADQAWRSRTRCSAAYVVKQCGTLLM